MAATSRKKVGALICAARTRQGTPCECKPLANGRCKFHGGLSTGPKSEAGKAKVRENLAAARAALARHEHAATRSARNADGNKARPLAWLARLTASTD